MRNRRLQSLITAGRWTLPTTIFICALCWALTSVFLPNLELETSTEESAAFLVSIRTLLPAGWIEKIASYIIYAIIGYFLIELNNRFGIIRMRASIQTAAYFLLVTACPEMHLLCAGDIAAIAFLISIFFLFRSYQQTYAASDLFYSFLFIGLGSLLFPQLNLLLVLWFIEAYRFQAFTLRSICGALLGWTLPYWILFGHAFYHNQMDLFYQPFLNLTRFDNIFNIQILHPWELGTLGYLLVLFIFSATHCIIAGFEDKIRTRAYVQFLINLTLILFLLIALQPSHCTDFLPLLMISSSILIGHLFVLTNSKTSNIIFLVSLSGLILLFAFNLWTLL